MNTETSYDQVAAEYARRIYDELKDKPLDRALLDRFTERVRGRGPACDLGCGPGQVARYLAENGVEVCGVDLSAGMVAEAARLNPGIPFKQGNMLALEVKDAAWAGIAAFYSIIHLDSEKIGAAFTELKRVLQPGGLLLLAFHVGKETRHFDELWGQPVDLDYNFFRPEDIQRYLETAGFVIEEVVERPPYENVEAPTQRAYIFARTGN